MEGNRRQLNILISPFAINQRVEKRAELSSKRVVELSHKYDRHTIHHDLIGPPQFKSLNGAQHVASSFPTGPFFENPEKIKRIFAISQFCRFLRMHTYI